MSNIMRREYRVLNESEKIILASIKERGEKFWVDLDGLGPSRELSLAKTKLEEAVMWATKHITR